MIGGALLALLISIPLGAIAAAKPRSATDRTILAVSLIGICTHPLVVALLLQQFPGNRWGIAPARGYCPFFGTAGEPGKFDGFSLSQDLGCAGPTAWASHLILPWITFSLFFVAIYTRLVRVRMIEVMDEPYIRTAEAKGMPRARIVRHHALRNAMSPVLTLVGMDIGLALGIALYVESVYRLPGLGLTTLSALNGDVGLRSADDPRGRARDRARDRGRQLHHRPRRRVDGPAGGRGRHPQLGRRPHRLSAASRL